MNFASAISASISSHKRKDPVARSTQGPRTTAEGLSSFHIGVLGHIPRTTRFSVKKRVVAVTRVGVLPLLPMAYIVSAQEAQEEQQRVPVFTDPIVGAWNCTIPPAGGAPAFNDIKNIHVGGTQSEIDDAAPPSQESPTVGTWARTGPLTYSQKAYQKTWTASGNFLGTFHYVGPMSLNAGLNQLSIEGTATLLDANGNVVTSFPFTASCNRL